MTALLPCLEVEPDRLSSGSAPARACVIWLHGLGADGHDFEPIVPILRTRGVRFVFPHAPVLPVTINNGFVMPAWYDIRTLDFDADDREDVLQIEASAKRITALIDRETGRGIASDRIVLAGFSQGAAMAVHVAVRHPQALAGLICLSGYPLVPERLAAERSDTNRAIEFFGGHGIHDDVVPIEAGRACRDVLRMTGTQSNSPTHGVDEWHEYAMGHEVCPDELEHVGAWLRQRLG